MNSEIKNDLTFDNGMPLASFVKDFLSGYDSREYSLDFESHQRGSYLPEQFAARNGSKSAVVAEHLVPNQFVIQQALERYFKLVHDALKDLEFSREDITIILNTTCGPYWQWDLGHNVASMVADDNGIDSLDELPSDSSMRLLLEKLIPLTQVQNAALVDFCEKFWRTRNNLPFDELCAELGLELVD